MSHPNKKEPFRRGPLKDIAVNRSTRFVRSPDKPDSEATDELVVDLVQILAAIGIELKNVREIAKALIKCGYVKAKRIV